jgi:uncharacterized protein
MATFDARYPAQVAIDAYGNGGFRFAGMSHRGSILCLPSGIYAWNVTSVAALTAADFNRVFTESGVGVVLLGMGRTMALAPLDIRRAFIEANIGLEAMDIGAAARTYNVLLAEGRPVAAALIAVE